MVEEVRMFKASDGKTFKTEQGAWNHESRIEANKVMERLNMTAEEVTEALKKIAPRNNTIKMLLERKPDWRTWNIPLLKQINKGLFKEPLKKTIYVHQYQIWRETKEDEIAVEKGENFADPEKHLKTKDEEYKVVKTEEVDEYTMKVYYDYKYTWEERMKMKLESGVKLTEREISELTHEMPQVYEEEGDEGRWDRYMLTVIDLLGTHYAIEWSKGLTESQENSYFNQPFKAKIETEEVVVERTTVIPID